LILFLVVAHSPRYFSRALRVGAITAVSGLLLYSLVDFNLQIPANVMLFLSSACLATSPPVNSNSRGKRGTETR